MLLAREHLNRYSGYAVFRFEGETENAKLEVTVDGEKIDFRVERPTGLFEKREQAKGRPAEPQPLAEAPKPKAEPVEPTEAAKPAEPAKPVPAPAPQQAASDPDLQAALAFAKAFVEPRLVVCEGRTLTQARDAGLPQATYQLQAPEVFVEGTKVANEFDRQKGLEWQGRFSLRGTYRVHKESWSPWQPVGDTFTAEIRKLKGEWEIARDSLIAALRRPESCAAVPPAAP